MFPTVICGRVTALTGRVGHRHIPSALSFPNSLNPPPSQPPTRTAAVSHAVRTSQWQSINLGVEEGSGVRAGRADGMSRQRSR
jgi:hypothetical protein